MKKKNKVKMFKKNEWLLFVIILVTSVYAQDIGSGGGIAPTSANGSGEGGGPSAKAQGILCV